MSHAPATWTSEFANALGNAAQEVIARRAGRDVTMAEFAPIVRAAKRDIRKRRRLSEYRMHFGAGLTEAVKLLRHHPGMSELIGENACTETEYGLAGLHTVATYTGTKQFLRGLVGRIVHFSAIYGHVEAARRTDQALHLGVGLGLSGHEITFFSGLVLDDPWRLAPGLWVMPYEFFRRQVDSMARLTYDSCLGRALWKDEYGKDPSVAVLARDFKWGPAFVCGEHSFPTDHDYEYGDRLLESESVIELLSLFAGLPFQIVAHHSRAEQWFYDLLGDGFDLGSHYFRRSPVDSDPGRGKEIDDEIRRPFQETVELWANFADEDRRRARLVASRLSGALSRKGSLALEDRILDVAIALEILYSMTRKDELANWAAVLLEDDKGNREETRIKVEALHDCRTAIVHDLSDSGDREVFDNVYSAGFEVARRTLIMHLNRGRFLSRLDRKLLERGIRPPSIVTRA